ncbi:MAG: hypothetical protein A3H96_23680 [Acidobacteria bacterium RIFCSPLOWO2_02_FULL_67_36]|nr:MAG: hypothetical protein A3H96_23680 [Acidobacteria bacterium RIFCSPLOWO2_02_FULL_67_36]OFW20546.1 MAG: hypothetical protein A3G21_23290 [Acidobacteria bacterium RIFCSPLOWO2_12_FULL_66_21]
MHLVIEVRQVVLMSPLRNLALVPIGSSIGVRTVSIALLEPSLVLALELVIEPHALDLEAARLEPRGLALVGAVDLGVVFELALTLEACVERLPMAAPAAAVRFEQVPATLGQHDRMFAMSGDARCLDQPLFAEVSEVALTRIQRPIRVVAQVASRYNPKGADRGECPALGAAQRVFAIAGIVDDLAVATAGQIEIAREDIARVGAAVAGIAIAVRPARVVPVAVVGAFTRVTPVIVAVAAVVVVILDPVGTWPTPKRQRIIVVPVAGFSVTAVSQVARVIVVTRVEVHDSLLQPQSAADVQVTWAQAMIARGYGRHGAPWSGIEASWGRSLVGACVCAVGNRPGKRRSAPRRRAWSRSRPKAAR